MFREIEADCYLMVDGDDTYSAESAPEMIDLVLEKQADMVIGDRLSGTYFSENKRNFHNFGNSLVRYAINKLFRNDIKDIMTGYRAFSYAFVKTFPVLSRGFEIETEMTIHSVFRNMQVENVVIRYQDRPEGSVSKLNTLRDGARVLGTIVRLFKNYRPFAFFTFLAVVLFLVSVIFLIPVFVTYFQTGLVPRFPTLIVGGFLTICALLLFITGVILSTLLEQERRQFEFTRLQVDQWQKAKRNRAKDLNPSHE